jgi:hypothetical protein
LLDLTEVILATNCKPVDKPHHLTNEVFFPERKENVDVHRYSDLIRRESKQNPD